jgi:hypothetical protein
MHESMNVISLVIFGQRDRYWTSLPAALVSFSGLYPGFRIRLHHASDAIAHPLFPFLRELADRVGSFDLIHVDRAYVDTEPTLWRMLPLWDLAVDLFLCRDVDSVSTMQELQAVRIFLREESPSIHGICGHPLHNTLLLGGLCGFKNRRLGFPREKLRSFDEYWQVYQRLNLQGRRGCDQVTLAAALWRHAPQILDSRLASAPPLDQLWPSLQVVTAAREVYECVDLDDLPAHLLDICDEMSFYPGQPHDDMRPALRKMLALDIPFVSELRRALDRFPEAERWLLA